MEGEDFIDNPLSQDLSLYDNETATTIQRLIAEDEPTRAQIMAEIAGKEPKTQIIGAVGFTQGINTAISPTTGPI